MKRRDLVKLAATILGGALSTSVANGVMAGATAAGKPSRKLFDAEARSCVSAIAELIIPTTDTPGAVAAGVPNFIELMVADWYTDQERRIFFAGLAEVNNTSKQRNGSSFVSSSRQQQVQVLQHMEQQAAATNEERSKRNEEAALFFNKIRELTVIGYFTSEIGAKQALAYNPMPMHYDGEYPLSKVGKQWSY